MMRRILPIERSMVPGSWTMVAAVTPMVFLIRVARWAAAALGGGRVGVGAALDVDGHRVHPAGAGQVQLEVRRQGRDLEDELLDLGREEVDAAQDDHVVGAAGDLLHPAHGAGGARQQPGQVAGAVADDRHRLLGQRGEDQLAELAVGQHLAGDRVDDLGVEVVLPDVQAVLGLDALLGDAGAHHLGQSVDVGRVDAGPGLDLGPHLVGPRLGAEDAVPAASSGPGRCPGAPSRRGSRACTTG